MAAPTEVPGTVEITSAEALRELLGEVKPRAIQKERVRLHARDREWLAASPFCLVATSDAEGNCDVSPKGDPAGFVKVLDDTTLAVPERPGNRRGDGYLNILSNPHVGLVSFVPGRGETLRINGRARLVREAPFFDDMVVRGHRPILATVVEIEQIFFHCGKALLRSELWRPETWDPDALPSHAQITKDVIPAETASVAELEHYYGQSYRERLYNG
ncbi:pyridoxamine 5'-phosphate oxidase family protein [Spirillospora sp. CA-253888]